MLGGDPWEVRKACALLVEGHGQVRARAGRPRRTVAELSFLFHAQARTQSQTVHSCDIRVSLGLARPALPAEP